MSRKKRTPNAQPRLKEETGKGRGRSSKGKTFNVQRSTSNIQWAMKEELNETYGSKGRTSNVQRSTFNVQRGQAKRLDLEGRLLDYAVRIIRLVDALPGAKAGRHVADQLLRSGTSPLANHGEVQGAESRKDFIHKLRICFKETRESRRWLRLVHRVPMVNPAKVEPQLRETEELIKIFSASIKTAEKNKK